MQLFKFNDKKGSIFNLDHVISIKKEDSNKILITDIDDQNHLTYKNVEDLTNDLKRMDSLINKSVEIINNVKNNIGKGFGTIKETIKETTGKISEEPTGFLFTSDFYGIIETYHMGDVLKVRYIDGAYYVIDKSNMPIFRAYDEGKKYGQLIFEREV